VSLPVPEPNHDPASNNKNNPNEDVGKQSANCTMDVECHCAIMKDINEQHSQWQSRYRRLNQCKREEAGATDGTKFIPNAQVQVENVEKVRDEEKFREDKVVVHLESAEIATGNTQRRAHPNWRRLNRANRP